MEPNKPNDASGPADNPATPPETPATDAGQPAAAPETPTPSAPATDNAANPIEPAKINVAGGAPNITPSTDVPDTSVKPDQPKAKKPKGKMMKIVIAVVVLVIGAALAYFLLSGSSGSTYADLETVSNDTYSVLIPAEWQTETTDDGTYYFSGATLDESSAFIVISDLGYDSEIETIVGLDGQDKTDALNAMAAIMEGLIEAGLTAEFDIDETSSEVLESDHADTAIRVSFTGTIKASGQAVQGAYLYLLQSDGTTMFINVSAETSIWNDNQDAINEIFNSFQPAS